jgi:hypothetical protein
MTGQAMYSRNMLLAWILIQNKLHMALGILSMTATGEQMSQHDHYSLACARSSLCSIGKVQYFLGDIYEGK